MLSFCCINRKELPDVYEKQPQTEHWRRHKKSRNNRNNNPNQKVVETHQDKLYLGNNSGLYK